MEENPAVQLILVEIQNPEYANLLNDIREFDWKIINKLRAEDLARIASTGFHFKNKGVANQKEEVKAFLIDHPCCMASDFEQIIFKLTVYGRLLSGEPATPNQPKPKTSITAEKKKRRKVIVIEEEESDLEFEPSSSNTEPEEDEKQNWEKKIWY